MLIVVELTSCNCFLSVSYYLIGAGWLKSSLSSYCDKVTGVHQYRNKCFVLFSLQPNVHEHKNSYS